MSASKRLRDLYDDAGVVELIVNDDGSVWVERAAGRLERQPFDAPLPEVTAFLADVAGPNEFGPKRPYADLSGHDGSRIHVLSAPIVRQGLSVTIRKRPQRRLDLRELVSGGTLSSACARFLEFAAGQRKNILIVGGTSSGKTTMLNALCGLVSPEDRVVVAEEIPELTLPQPHVVYLKTRLRDPQGLPDVTLRELVVNTLRMRPDRVIVGEVRGAEALDLLQAMNIGQEGVMATLHANSCREGLQRLETLVLSAGLDMPLRAVRGHVALAVDLIVFVARFSDGQRRLTQVSEVTGMELDNILMSDLFVTDTRRNGHGPTFTLRPTGAIPRFFEKLQQEGFETPIHLFKA